MKHAGPAALDALDDIITALRAHDGVREVRRGVFYRKSKAWLHFHEDASGLFADLRENTEWQRFAVSQQDERNRLLAVVARVLSVRSDAA